MTTSPDDVAPIRDFLAAFPSVEVIIVAHTEIELVEALRRVGKFIEEPEIAGRWFKPSDDIPRNRIRLEVADGYLTDDLRSRILAAASPVDIDIIEVVDPPPDVTT